MRVAITRAQEGIEGGQSPFGAAIVYNQALLVSAHNTVWRDGDPTAHAEINAIRLAAREIGSIDLSACLMFTTCEPCPMCLSAIHWSRIRTVYFGAAINDAKIAGFSELSIPAIDMAQRGGSQVKIVPALLEQECQQLFAYWRDRAKGKAY